MNCKKTSVIFVPETPSKNMKKIDWELVAVNTLIIAFIAATVLFFGYIIWDHYQLSCKRYKHCGVVKSKFHTYDKYGDPHYYIQVGLSNHMVSSSAFNSAKVGETKLCLTLDGFNSVLEVEITK